MTDTSPDNSQAMCKNGEGKVTSTPDFLVRQPDIFREKVSFSYDLWESGLVKCEVPAQPAPLRIVHVLHNVNTNE